MEVLIVDDNATNLRILEDMVLSWGMNPILAEQGSDALKLMGKRGKSIRVVLLDHMMPGMDGIELAGEIRARSAKLGEPIIIMLSSAGGAGHGELLQSLRIVHSLVKPVKPSKLLDALAEELGIEVRRKGEPKRGIQQITSLRSLRILIAEDGRVNQIVASQMLKSRGHSVEVAENGRVAVDAFSRGGFDAILMDVQMPEMNGYEATAAIREREGTGCDRIPIIAMTANAMKGDREKCIDAGMDDYVTKPIDPGEVFEKLEFFFEDESKKSEST